MPSPPWATHQLTTPGSIVNLNHFRLLRVVGKGAFGKVRIVERKDTGLTFALKYIRKDEGQSSRHVDGAMNGKRLTVHPVVRSESVRNIIRERRMLEQLNHPFLCNLRYSFQDIEYLYVSTCLQLMSIQRLMGHEVHCCGFNEWWRFTISYITKDFHRGGGSLLDGGAGLRFTIHPRARDHTPRCEAG